MVKLFRVYDDPDLDGELAYEPETTMMSRPKTPTHSRFVAQAAKRC